MLSYHNDYAVKQKYVERFAKHRELDQVIQGKGFEPNTGRGCFVGCTLNNYEHSQFPVELGWPEWLARLADMIFERLPKEEAPQFGTDLLNSVQIGVDLEPVRHLIAIRRLKRLILQQTALAEKHLELASMFQQVIAAITAVIRCHEAETGAFTCDVIDWSAARSAAESAWSATRSADESAWLASEASWAVNESALSADESSAWSAAESAAWSAARSADESDWSAAESAAWSEDWSAARSAFKQERDDLLDVLRSMEPAI